MHDNNIELLKKKKLKEIQKQQYINDLENLAKQYLTKEAVERYSNLKVAHPELAVNVVSLIANTVQTNQLKEKINDEQFKKILMQIQPDKEKFRVIK
ncbi:hypothetical protein HYX18_01170 [Candidatus Woesearchaeota archaeon]|nr:hypothetical protein [Candidatus Woesearchaeota archaeon]